jgi:biotin synthase
MMQQVDAATSPSLSSPKSDRNGFVRSDDSALVIRYDWAAEEAAAIYHAPFIDLLLRAQTTHRTVFDPNKVQFSKLLNIKAGGCPEDCSQFLKVQGPAGVVVSMAAWMLDPLTCAGMTVGAPQVIRLAKRSPAAADLV